MWCLRGSRGRDRPLRARLFANSPLGLNLVRERTGREAFALPAAAVDDPEGHLNSLIRETYAR